MSLLNIPEQDQYAYLVGLIGQHILNPTEESIAEIDKILSLTCKPLKKTPAYPYKCYIWFRTKAWRNNNHKLGISVTGPWNGVYREEISYSLRIDEPEYIRHYSHHVYDKFSNDWTIKQYCNSYIISEQLFNDIYEYASKLLRDR